MQSLQLKILVFTFGASLLPVLVLISVVWKILEKPLVELEKTRLDDQVLAFRGYESATEKGLKNLISSYANWTDLYNAVQTPNPAWVKKEVSDQLLFTTDIDLVRVIQSANEKIIGEAGTKILTLPLVEKKIQALSKKDKSSQYLIDTGKQNLVLLASSPIYRSDGTGKAAGTLIAGQLLDKVWLRQFLNYSQPTTRVEIISLKGKVFVSSNADGKLDVWEKNYFTSEILAKISQKRSVYHIQPELGLNTIYAPLYSGNQPIAILKLQIVATYFQQARLTLTRLIVLVLTLVLLLSVLIAHFLAKQISHPIIQLANRSKTLASGDLTSPIPSIQNGGEIGQLANAYQEMANSLSTLINNLEQLVAQRTQELELARQTLEERVEERTLELVQKNQELEIKTEQLHAALQNLKMAESQLIQTEKMSSLGNLVAGIAHEINNPINFIYANISYIENYTQDLFNLIKQYQQRYSDPEIQRYADRIELDYLIQDLPKLIASMDTGATRIKDIISSLRNFSRHDEAEIKKVNLHEGIDSTLVLLQHRLNPHHNFPVIQVIKEYDNLPLVECYSRQINQVFMHVLVNAIDALELHQERVDKKIIIQTKNNQDKTVTIKIIDNGIGIDNKNISQIFDPFFTTKSVGKGTGLGLSVCYQIIQNHQGNIQVISQFKKETQVIIQLPYLLKNHVSHIS
ncbi:HAMP domain-containing protein [Calothrix sp. FACHB-1219]|uniref:ATP-binding protein n=1 Tax=unclassified Calothrix TaxID=2619626 RepID=UPI001688B321|nr:MULTISPECIES: ATP-binding protein [unclassified Calothrix]MBD2204187.1 HAMP domain-containing protein [Calothrix sp. FACHB-168]MBD2220493.1 HAMP domain-containing protein [Calothrix sp. FACHB-1219]